MSAFTNYTYQSSIVVAFPARVCASIIDNSEIDLEVILKVSSQIQIDNSSVRVCVYSPRCDGDVVITV